MLCLSLLPDIFWPTSQANDFNREERFNIPLFRKLGDLGVLGITVPEEYGGAGKVPAQNTQAQPFF
jgi:alkylation response protein AidB-like acyl-CoA dehydrogenase